LAGAGVAGGLLRILLLLFSAPLSADFFGFLFLSKCRDDYHSEKPPTKITVRNFAIRNISSTGLNWV